MDRLRATKHMFQVEAGGRRADLRIGGAYFAVGFAPISALALSIVGLLPLPYGALLLVLPAVLLGGGLAFRHPSYGKIAGKGLLVGLLAVLIYDCTRIPFIITGVWSDFIPHIAERLLMTSEPNWVVGYLWRYFGNGGGMGLSFVVGCSVLRPRLNKWVLGIGYGVAIWSCLLLTLVLAPPGAGHLFALTPLTFGLSLLGHVVYGAVLSIGTSWLGVLS